MPNLDPPRVPKADVVEVPNVDPTADPKPPEAGAAPAPKILLVPVEGNVVVLAADPRPLKGLAPGAFGVTPKVPKGDVVDLERAAKPEAAKAEDEVWGSATETSEGKPDGGFKSDLLLAKVPKGETSEVSEKPLAGSIWVEDLAKAKYTL